MDCGRKLDIPQKNPQGEHANFNQSSQQGLAQWPSYYEVGALTTNLNHHHSA